MIGGAVPGSWSEFPVAKLNKLSESSEKTRATDLKSVGPYFFNHRCK
jgi:hypothetical protein